MRGKATWGRKKCTCWTTWWNEIMWHSKEQLKTGKSGRNC